MSNKMSIADAMRSVMTQIREQTAEHNKKWEMYSEVQRLRAALEKARQYVVNGFELGYIDDREGYTEAIVREIDKALSTTTEPTDAAKVERFECPCCGCEINAKERVGTEEWRHKYFGAEWPKAEGDGNDA